MPRVAVANSDSEEETPRSAKKQSVGMSKSATKHKEPESEEEEVVSEAGDEEEYEIEAILDGRLGAFPNGKIGYLVKWKGYGEEHNSWVSEEDAGNAQALIDEYWTQAKKKGKGRKSTGPAAPRSSATKTRKSSREESSEVGEAPKKRGRPPKAKPAELTSDEEVDENTRTKKRPRKSGTRTQKGTSDAMDEDDDTETFRSMKPWMSAATWEGIVDTIDTVERTDDGRLLVYFTLKDGKGRGREITDICKDKMPRKMLEFYEANLRWRANADMEE